MEYNVSRLWQTVGEKWLYPAPTDRQTKWQNCYAMLWWRAIKKQQTVYRDSLETVNNLPANVVQQFVGNLQYRTVYGRRSLSAHRQRSQICHMKASRPIILCRRSTGIEQSAVSRTGCIVAHHLPTRTENISFPLEFSGPLVANSLSPAMLYAGTLLTV